MLDMPEEKFKSITSKFLELKEVIAGFKDETACIQYLMQETKLSREECMEALTFIKKTDFGRKRI